MLFDETNKYLQVPYFISKQGKFLTNEIRVQTCSTSLPSNEQLKLENMLDNDVDFTAVFMLYVIPKTPGSYSKF